MEIIDRLEKHLTFENFLLFKKEKAVFSAQISIFLLFGLGVSASIFMIIGLGKVYYAICIGIAVFIMFILISVGVSDYLLEKLKKWRKISVEVVIDAEANIDKDTNDSKNTIDKIKEDINSLASAIDYLIALSLKQKMDYARKLSVELGTENVVDLKRNINNVQDVQEVLRKDKQQIIDGLEKVKDDIEKIS